MIPAQPRSSEVLIRELIERIVHLAHPPKDPCPVGEQGQPASVWAALAGLGTDPHAVLQQRYASPIPLAGHEPEPLAVAACQKLCLRGVLECAAPGAVPLYRPAFLGRRR